MQLRRQAASVGLLLALAGCAACTGGGAGTGPPTAPDDLPSGLPPDITPAQVGDGRNIFHNAGNCYLCHGDNGGGTTSAPNLTQGPWLHIDGSFDAIVQLVTTGVPMPKQFAGFMPPRGGATLSVDQIRWVAGYVFTISRGKTPTQGGAAAF